MNSDPTVYCTSKHETVRRINGFESVMVVRAERQSGISILYGDRKVIRNNISVTGFTVSEAGKKLLNSIMAQHWYIDQGALCAFDENK